MSSRPTISAPRLWQGVLYLLIMPTCAYAQYGSLDLATSSFFGGGGQDRIQYTYVDDQGWIYLAGNTKSSNFPATQGAFDSTHNGNQDGFVAKFSPDGTQLIWATFLGGSLRDQAYGIRVDSNGNVYVVGATGSSNFPTTPGAYDRQFNGGTQGSGGYGDVFAAKLSPDGSRLIYSTYLGGSGGGEENSRGALHLDAAGNLYVAGHTQSTSFPTTARAYQRTFIGGIGEGFILKLSANGSNLLASTYLGGNGNDWILEDIAALPDGSLVVGGGTSSVNFPTTPGALQPNFNGPGGQDWWTGDGFVTRISSDLSTLIYSTYVGGTDWDQLGSVIVDSAGRAILTGGTKSADFPVTNGAYDSTHSGSWDGFLAILSADGSRLDAATYIGGTNYEELTRTRLDASNRVITIGNTASTNWPTTPGAMQPNFGGGNTDGVLAIFSPDLSSVHYSTHVGSNGDDRGRGLWLGPSGQIVLGGDTSSGNFPSTPNGFDPSHNGDKDGYFLIFAGAAVFHSDFESGGATNWTMVVP